MAVNFGLPCIGKTFCSLCRNAICERCYPTHAASQHITDGVQRTIDVLLDRLYWKMILVHVQLRCWFLLQVALLERRFLAVAASSMRTGGLDYNWMKIQRVRDVAGEYPNWKRASMKGGCSPCGDHIQISMDHCSPTSKVAKCRDCAVFLDSSTILVMSLPYNAEMVPRFLIFQPYPFLIPLLYLFLIPQPNYLFLDSLFYSVHISHHCFDCLQVLQFTRDKAWLLFRAW